jgi:elongation factor P
MATTADIKKGLCIKFKDDLWSVVDFQHHKPGKGGAYMRTRLKSITSSKTLDHTFNSGETLDIQSITRRKFQFTYKDDTGYNFMDNETFDQITMAEDEIEGWQYLKDGQEVEVCIHEDTEKPLFAEVPAYVNLRITYTEPGLRGDTATNTLKSATVETGATIQVPIFIEDGELIKVDTRNGVYSERVKVAK